MVSRSVFVATIAGLLIIQAASVGYLTFKIETLKGTPEPIRREALANGGSTGKSVSPPDSTVPNRDTNLAPRIATNGRVTYGAPTARLTIEAFTDLECPLCKKMHPEIRAVVENSDGVVNWQIRHFPLEKHGQAALDAANLVECVATSYGNRQAWGILEAIYDRSAGGGAGVDDLITLSRNHAVSGRMAETCLESGANNEKILSDIHTGQALGITGTPSVLIRDSKTGRTGLLRGYKSREQLAAAIQRLLQTDNRKLIP